VLRVTGQPTAPHNAQLNVKRHGQGVLNRSENIFYHFRRNRVKDTVMLLSYVVMLPLNILNFVSLMKCDISEICI